MSTFPNVDEILDFAIDGEQSAVDLYTGLAAEAKNPTIKKAVQDLKIADYTVEEEPGPDADYQTVLIFAMKKEKAAFKLYTDLAGRVDDAGVRDLLLGLAQEEAKHKLRFEIEYDDNILVEN